MSNLFAVYLPQNCSVIRVFPQTTLSLSTTSWANTDLTYKLSLSQLVHVFIRYQFTKCGRQTYTIACLVINSVIQPHTMSIRGNNGNYDAGLFEFWQGSLSTGTYQITIQHRCGYGVTDTHYTNYDYLIRAMDIIYCDWHAEMIRDAHNTSCMLLYCIFKISIRSYLDLVQMMYN